MNQTILIIVGVLFFAITTAVLYAIGLKKKMQEDEVLAQKLLHNSSRKVIDYLKTHDQISMKEIEKIIQGVSAKNFYSGKTAIVANSKEFKEQLVDFLIKNDYLVRTSNKKEYKLSSKKNRKQ